MLIESMIIKLIHSGADIGPDYSLKIYGNGKVIYTGIENVKVLGRVEGSIDNDKVISLLSEFKESDFFSLNHEFFIENSVDRSYTVISISIPQGNGEMTTKSIKYYHGDKRVPEKLKNLANKIEEIIGSNQWVGNLSEHGGFDQKIISKSSLKSNDDIGKTIHSEKKRKPNKFIIAAVIVIIVFCLIFIGIYSIFTNLPSENNNSSNNTGKINIEKNLEITVLEPASDIREYRDYDMQTMFFNGSKVWIYLEYSNISTIDNDFCNLTLSIKLKNGDYILQPENYSKSEIGNQSHGWWFNTDPSWLPGIYYVTVTIKDNISNLTTEKLTIFYLN